MKSITVEVHYLLLIFLAAAISYSAESRSRSPLLSSTTENAFLIDTTVMYAHARGNQGWPSIAGDGENYLAVWHDSRCFPQHDIYCARINSNGHILDSAGIRVATITHDNAGYYCIGTPAVSYNGSLYFVVYQDCRNLGETDIYGVRVTPGGTVLDPDGIAISTAQGHQQYPCIASNGTDFFVVWEDNRYGNTDIYGARVSQNGVVEDPDGIQICNEAHGQILPSVACNGTDYMAVWQDARDSMSTQYDIYGARIAANGVLLDTNGIAVFADTALQIEPSITYDGANYFIVWEDRRVQVLCIKGARVDTSGNVLDPDGISISGMPSMMEWQPSVIFNGTDYLVVWADDRNGTYPDIYGARVDQNGNVLDTVNIPISLTGGMKELPAVASNGNGFVVIWEDDRDYPSGDVYGARVSAAGTVLDPQGFDVTTAVAFQDEPGIAYCGENFLAAWVEYRSGIYLSDIYGARVDATGNILDSPSFMICTDQFGQYSPAIAFDGTNYCVAWTHNIGGAWRIKGARISSLGIVLDPAYIDISSGGNALSPNISSSGDGFLTVWIDYRNSLTSPDIYGSRIGSAGYVLDPTGIAISTLGGLEYKPSVCFGDMCYLIAWEDMRNGPYDIFCARMDTNGLLIDPSGIAVAIADQLQRNTAIAFDGTNFLVVWQDNRNGSYDIYGARVGENGVVLDPAGICVSAAIDDQINPSVVFDGNDFIVVWEDYRDIHSDIHGAIIDTSGAVVDSFIAIAQPGPQHYPKLSHGPGTKTILTYSGWTDHINAHPANAMRVWAKFHPELGIEHHEGYTVADTRYNLSVSPNPFSKLTTVSFSIEQITERIELKIYDVAGRLVRDLYCAMPHASCAMHISWGGTDQYNRQLPSGVYFVQLKSGDNTATEKILLVR
ncbi:MAG: T9SS type A sorting domain-containing protein [candidate division WOR-3 bacterium]|nr:MAG: T9SS type A sorting domain-containing protein [candidate division WOR-3 bacterium]